MAEPRLNIVDADEVREHFEASGDLAGLVRSIGAKHPGGDYLVNAVGMPLHLGFVLTRLAEERGRALGADVLDSIPFYSLCRGLLLPLSSLAPERVAALFGILVEPHERGGLDAAGREALVGRFLAARIGLSPVEKLACLLGDPFRGRRGTWRRDSLMRLLLSVQMTSRSSLLDRLAVVGDVAVLFAEGRPHRRVEAEAPLTAAEVMQTLRLVPGEKRTLQFDLLRSLLLRMGKLEAYFLAKLLLRKAGFGFDYQGAVLARALADAYGAGAAEVAHAIALADPFRVADLLDREGPSALRRLQLQPLVAVRPALAGGITAEIKKWPVWVERKYDGIRLMLHKSTDAHGASLGGAYTRTRGDWLELVPGLDASIRALPARSLILDGELYGTVGTADGPRPATVYEVNGFLQGEGLSRPVALRYAAFDLLYLDGRDLTGLPLGERRRVLQFLVARLGGWPLPVPISIAEGQLAAGNEDLNRLYQHFRAQGYEGVIAKDLDGPYRLGERDGTWLKRKPEVTLDLVLLQAIFAVTGKERVGLFGAYVIGGRTPEGGFAEVGEVAGVDRARDAEIQAEIVREGLLTGRRTERKLSSGTHPGVELRPGVVVTVKFEGITRDDTGALSLRSPKIAHLRTDKSPDEVDSVDALDRLYLRQRVS